MSFYLQSFLGGLCAVTHESVVFQTRGSRKHPDLLLQLLHFRFIFIHLLLNLQILPINVHFYYTSKNSGVGVLHIYNVVDSSDTS